MNGYDDEDFARAMKSKGPKGLKLEVGPGVLLDF